MTTDQYKAPKVAAVEATNADWWTVNGVFRQLLKSFVVVVDVDVVAVVVDNVVVVVVDVVVVVHEVVVVVHEVVVVVVVIDNVVVGAVAEDFSYDFGVDRVLVVEVVDDVDKKNKNKNNLKK